VMNSVPAMPQIYSAARRFARPARVKRPKVVASVEWSNG
jgi:hypothetical protein